MKGWFEQWLKKYGWAKNSIKRKRRFHKKFCKSRCRCTFSDDVARVTVNFAILYLESYYQVIPLSKMQIIQNMKIYSPRLSDDVLKGLKLAIKFSGKDKFLTLKQVNEILISADWFKEKLIKSFVTSDLN